MGASPGCSASLEFLSLGSNPIRLLRQNTVDGALRLSRGVSGSAGSGDGLVHRQGKGVGDFRPLGVRPSGLGVLHFFSEFLHRLIIRKLALGYVLPGSDITEIIDVAGNLVL